MGKFNLYSPPNVDEIEISIFGPGYGESIVLFLTENNWVVIDSCIDVDSKISIPLTYLKNLGVHVQEDVKYIIISHWHDDHIRGISQLYDECESAKVVISSAMLSNEFLQFIIALSENAMMTNSGVDEMYKLINTAKRRSEETQQRVKYASTDKIIWGNQDNTIQLISLSPSEKDYQNSLIGLSKLISQLEGTKRRATPVRPNNCSIVLWIRTPNDNILLGSDMEKSIDPDCGWKAITNCQSINDALASFYKVAHHGSKTGNDDEIWKKLLINNPIAAFTPFSKGKHTIPSLDEVRQISINTDKLYATKLITSKRPLLRSRAVEKQLKEVDNLVIKPIQFSNGHLRFRKKAISDSSGWNIELFPESEKL